MFLFALVLIPGIGHSVNGSARWIGYGPLGFQVSELTKFAIVIYMAGYLVRRNNRNTNEITGFFKTHGHIWRTIAVLLLREPDFGATVVVMATSFRHDVFSRHALRHFIVLIIFSDGSFAVIAISAPYRLAR